MHQPRRYCRRYARTIIERLEYRQMLSSVVLQSVSTVDSQSITLKYQIDGNSLASAFDLAVYRSRDGQFDPSHLRSTDETIAQVTLGRMDEAHQIPTGEGAHTQTAG